MRGYPPPDFSTTAWYNRPFACAGGPWQAVSWQVWRFNALGVALATHY